VLLQYAVEDEVLGRNKEFLLVDENLGYSHRIETEEFELIRPVVVTDLQELLIGYPNWEIVIALGNCGGLIIRENERLALWFSISAVLDPKQPMPERAET